MTAESWPKPEPNWLPLWRAPFYFFPDYAAPGAAFQRRMNARLQSIIVGQPDIAHSIAGDRILVECGNASLIIDAETYFAEIVDRDDRDRKIVDDLENPCGGLSELLSQLEECRLLPNYAAAVATLARVAARLRDAMLRDFSRAIDGGHALIVGRWGRVGAPYAPIYPDQWAHLRGTLHYTDFDEWGHPKNLTLRDGDVKIFDPKVRPLLRVVTPKARAIHECTAWLIEERRAGRWGSQSRIWELAKEGWPDLSIKGFKRAVGAAQNAIHNNDFDRRGPKRNLVCPPK